MLCYQIIASANSGPGLQKLLHELGDLDKDWAKTIKVKGGEGAGDYNLDQKALLQEAIKISAAIQMEDF